MAGHQLGLCNCVQEQVHLNVYRHQGGMAFIVFKTIPFIEKLGINYY